MKRSSTIKAGSVKLSAKQQEQLVSTLRLDYKQVIKQGVNDYVEKLGIVLLEALMSAEIAELCGEFYKHDQERTHVRWGSQKGMAVVDGGKVAVQKPRVRKGWNGMEGEVELESYQAMNNKKLFDEQLLAKVIAGVSSRSFANTVTKAVRKRGISKSSISRKAIAATKPTVDAFLAKRWDEHKFTVLMIDGIHLGGKQMIVCIGIETGGKKRLLGLRLGATENEIVCRDLLRDLIDRGLNHERQYLFVLDGSRALAKTVRAG